MAAVVTVASEGSLNDAIYIIYRVVSDVTPITE